MLVAASWSCSWEELVVTCNMSLPENEPAKDAVPEMPTSATSIPAPGADVPVNTALDDVPVQASKSKPSATSDSESLDTALQALSINDRDDTRLDEAESDKSEDWTDTSDSESLDNALQALTIDDHDQDDTRPSEASDSEDLESDESEESETSDSESLDKALQALNINDQEATRRGETNTAPTAIPPTALAETPLSAAQHRFILSVVRKLKGDYQATPFRKPVDHVMLMLPQYPIIITHPMDLGTVQRKAKASTPGKPDLNSVVGHYTTVNEFVADIRLIFANCLKFNGKNSPVTTAGQYLEGKFNELMKGLPQSREDSTTGATASTLGQSVDGRACSPDVATHIVKEGSEQV